MSRAIVLAMLVVAACAAPSGSAVQQGSTAATAAREPGSASHSPEGVFDYVGTLRGEAVVQNGRYSFVYGASTPGASMIGDAGTYRIVGDTVFGHNTFSTLPDRVGREYRWTVQSWAGDTATYVVFDDSNKVAGNGRAVRVR